MKSEREIKEELKRLEYWEKRYRNSNEYFDHERTMSRIRALKWVVGEIDEVKEKLPLSL